MMEPEVSVSNILTQRIIVLFSAPDEPITPNVVFWGILRLISFKAIQYISLFSYRNTSFTWFISIIEKSALRLRPTDVTFEHSLCSKGGKPQSIVDSLVLCHTDHRCYDFMLNMSIDILRLDVQALFFPQNQAELDSAEWNKVCNNSGIYWSFKKNLCVKDKWATAKKRS